MRQRKGREREGKGRERDGMEWEEMEENRDQLTIRDVATCQLAALLLIANIMSLYSVNYYALINHFFHFQSQKS